MRSCTALFYAVILWSCWPACSIAENDVYVKYLHVESNIQSRFATTLVTSRLTNPSSAAQEAVFYAQLPEAAFITHFAMEIGGNIIVGNVTEKERARTAYEVAKSRGQSAGLVSQRPRETNSFSISTHVAAGETVTFNLTYQEILQRVHGAYKYVINLQSNKLKSTSDVEIDVIIVEQGEFSKISIPKFGPKIGEKTNLELLNADQEPDAERSTLTADSVSTTLITYKPKLSEMQSNTLAGQLAVLYDVQRDYSGGQIQVVNGYFVHFFAPQGLPKVPKHLVFVLDKSGSMQGRKFEQTKASMTRILRDLVPEDFFNVIMFDSVPTTWLPQSVPATEENIRGAIAHINAAHPRDLTNIYDSLEKAVQILNAKRSDSVVSMIIFMTDGQPNVGRYREPNSIVEKITEMNKETRYLIHSIAFGEDASFDLLQRISSSNYGLARKVYADSDADMQLTGFYTQISSPLITKLTVTYFNETIDVSSLVQDQSYNYYDGGEIVIIGKLKNTTTNGYNAYNVEATVQGQGASGQLQLRSRPPCYVNGENRRPLRCGQPEPVRAALPASSAGVFIERMWAYQTIKKLTKESEVQPAQKTRTNQKVLRLSLKYGFVTELTSMVVVQPNNQNTTTLARDYVSNANRDVSNPAPTRIIGRSYDRPPLRLGGGGGGAYSSRGIFRSVSKSYNTRPYGPPAPRIFPDHVTPRPFPRSLPELPVVFMTTTTPASTCEIDLLVIMNKVNSTDQQAQTSQLQTFLDSYLLGKSSTTRVNLQVINIGLQGHAAVVYSADGITNSASVAGEVQRSLYGLFSPTFDALRNVVLNKGGTRKAMIWIGYSTVPTTSGAYSFLNGMYQDMTTGNLPRGADAFCVA